MPPPDSTHRISHSQVSGVALYQAPEITDPRGSLLASEFPGSLPFVPHRYFMVFDVPSEQTRGEHAHRKCHQFLVCTHGKVRVLVDDGRNKESFLLDHPSLGLYLPPMIWASQSEYSADASVLVLASDPYEAEDYIRTYDTFLSLTVDPA